MDYYLDFFLPRNSRRARHQTFRARSGSELLLFGNSRFSRAKKFNGTRNGATIGNHPGLFQAVSDAVRSYAPIFTIPSFVERRHSPRLSLLPKRAATVAIDRSRSLALRGAKETRRHGSPSTGFGGKWAAQKLGAMQPPAVEQQRREERKMDGKEDGRKEEEGEGIHLAMMPTLANNHSGMIKSVEKSGEKGEEGGEEEQRSQNDGVEEGKERVPPPLKADKSGHHLNPAKNAKKEGEDGSKGAEVKEKAEAKEKRRHAKVADFCETVSLFDFEWEPQQQNDPDLKDLLDRHDFHEHFDTNAYLRDFYTRVDDPAMQLILFHLPNLVVRLGPIQSLLDFGCGPTIHVAVCFRETVEDIYLADYLPQNRAELDRWLNGQSQFDWTVVLRIIAAREAVPMNEVSRMERQTRDKVRAILHCDCLTSPAIRLPPSLPGHHQFGALTTFLTIEYCCLSRAEYAAAIRRICGHIRPGGFLIMGGVLEETWCAFGGRKFKCLYIDRPFMLNCLQAADLQLWRDHLGTQVYYERDGMFLLVAKKTAAGEDGDGQENSDYEN